MSNKAKTAVNPWSLTASEIEALEAVIELGRFKAAASKLGKAESTIELRMTMVRAKMQTHTIGCAVAWSLWKAAA